MSTKKKNTIWAALLSAALIFGANPAYAQSAQVQESIQDSIEEEQAVLSKYSDEDILKLLLDGSGPVAEANPKIVDALGFTEDRERINPDIIDEHVAGYLDFNPTFNEDIVQQLSSGNPTVVEAALQQFGFTYQDYVKEVYDVDFEQLVAPAAGCGGSVCVQVVVVTIGAIYATVGIATFVAAVAAVTYLMDDDAPLDDIERQEVISELTLALAA